MATPTQHADEVPEPLTLPAATARRLLVLALILGAAGLAGGIAFSFLLGSGVEGGFTAGLRRFFLSYLTAYGFVLTIVLGSLFFVMLQHVTRAGWSVTVRRIPEALANTMPALAVLSLPILLSLVLNGANPHPTLYPWAADHPESAEHAGEDGGDAETAAQGPAPEHGERPDAPQDAPRFGMQAIEDAPLLTDRALTVADAREHLEFSELTAGKTEYLNRPFFVLRLVVYFAVWIAMAGFYWRNSVLQDATGDPALTTRMQKWAPACFLAYAATVTLAAWDLWLTLDPHFFSTIWGVYIFAGAVIGALATTILIYQFLRMGGLLRRSVNREHYHDLGKLLFAFVFFWGYIAFSQFMLIWYANIPETTYWFGVRGATTVVENHGFGTWPLEQESPAPAPVGWWTIIIMTLLVAHLLIPFAGLLSRHVKRNLTALGFWSGWMLVMHYLDHYWIIMPEAMAGGWQLLPIPEIACLLFMVAAAGGYFVWNLSSVSLRPVADPRLHESLALHTT